MPAGLFAPALKQLPEGGPGVFGPVSFRAYLEQNGLPAADTAASISVNALEALDPGLRAAQAMVLRLGRATDGKGTAFALVRSRGGLADFFLDDEEVFRQASPSTYLPEMSVRALYPYQLLASVTESSLVNLAFASGLLGQALGLDKPYPTAAPATGHGTHTFAFRAHADLEPVFWHTAGQVEVDAVFLAQRQGRECLFVLEAKAGAAARTLAKHKLVYPMLALAPRVPVDIPIVPVYLRATLAPNEVRYQVAECAFPDPRKGVACLADLVPRETAHLAVPLASGR